MTEPHRNAYGQNCKCLRAEIEEALAEHEAAPGLRLRLHCYRTSYAVVNWKGTYYTTRSKLFYYTKNVKRHAFMRSNTVWFFSTTKTTKSFLTPKLHGK